MYIAEIRCKFAIESKDSQDPGGIYPEHILLVRSDTYLRLAYQSLNLTGKKLNVWKNEL